jgi:hypothetical protein
MSVSVRALRQQQRLQVLATYPEPETEKERSPIDYPQVRVASMVAYGFLFMYFSGFADIHP